MSVGRTPAALFSTAASPLLGQGSATIGGRLTVILPRSIEEGDVDAEDNLPPLSIGDHAFVWGHFLNDVVAASATALTVSQIIQFVVQKYGSQMSLPYLARLALCAVILISFGPGKYRAVKDLRSAIQHEKQRKMIGEANTDDALAEDTCADKCIMRSQAITDYFENTFGGFLALGLIITVVLNLEADIIASINSGAAIASAIYGICIGGVVDAYAHWKMSQHNHHTEKETLAEKKFDSHSVNASITRYQRR